MGEFAKLWAAGAISSLGDEVTAAAGPLLAAALTRDPMQVAGLMVAEQLPWTLLALPSGAVVDRVDRRRLIAVASVVRVIALGGLGLALATAHTTLPLLYLIFLLLGCAGVLSENAASTMVPAVVEPAQLERANGRMIATRIVGDSLLGPPLAGWLFVTALWLPFVLNSAAFVLVTVLCLVLSAAAGQAPGKGSVTTFRAAIAEGVRWLLRHRLLRTIAITVAVSNVALGAVTSIMVLIAQQRLGLGSVGYGLLLTSIAIGGVAGGLITSRVVAAIGPGTTLRAGMVIETLAHLGLALTRDSLLAGTVLALLGLHLVVFSTINTSLRQSVAPPGMLGRIHSAYRLISTTGMLLGAVIGGVIARYFGLTAPFWLGVVTLTVVTACVWPVLNNHDLTAGRSSAPRAAP